MNHKWLNLENIFSKGVKNVKIFIRNNTLLTYREFYKLYDIFIEYNIDYFLYEHHFISILSSFQYQLKDEIIKHIFCIFCVLNPLKMCLFEFILGMSVLMMKNNLLSIEDFVFELLSVKDKITKERLLTLSRKYILQIDSHNMSVKRLCKWILLHKNMEDITIEDYHVILTNEKIRNTIHYMFKLTTVNPTVNTSLSYL